MLNKQLRMENEKLRRQNTELMEELAGTRAGLIMISHEIIFYNQVYGRNDLPDAEVLQNVLHLCGKTIETIRESNPYFDSRLKSYEEFLNQSGES